MLGLSIHALAERTGLSTAAIEYLDEHGDLPQRSPARRVREALGLQNPAGRTHRHQLPPKKFETPSTATRSALIDAEAHGRAHEWHLANSIP